MFGVTHVMARDGYSGMIVAFSTMPVKNNLIIYDEIYGHFTMTYGLYDQVCVDGGQEFNLEWHIQEYLRDQRREPAINPFKSTKSTDNNIIECICFEVNSRLNHTIKNALGQFATDGLIDMTQDYTNLQIRRETELSRKFSFKSMFYKIQQDILEFRFSIQFFLRVSFVLLQTELSM